MAEKTGIAWTDSTFNPWWGCTRIAPACDHCYAAALDARTGGDHWGNEPRRRTSETNWREPLQWQGRAEQFERGNGRRRRVFCASMADVFDNQVPPEWRADLWQLIAKTPALDWQLLTKRPQNIEKMLPAFWDLIRGHVWLGTTVEDQEHADANIPHLLKHNCAVRFISAEPLLGPLSIEKLIGTGHGLDWVISGGESGPHWRPGDNAWFRKLADDCAMAGVPFFMKQLGGYPDKRDRIAQFPDDLRIREFPVAA